MKKNVIEKVEHCENEYISNIFLTEKKDGSSRPIINLKGLTTFVTQKHFKMESLQSIKHLIHKNCFSASADLKDAYFTIPVAKVHRKYLRFEWKGNLYEFTCLCFGLSSAPRIFTKLMKPVVVCLRRQGYTLVIYLDDMLIIAESCSESLSALCDTIKLLTDLGFVINADKSNLTPSQRIEFLGFIFDSTNLSISLPQEKIQRLTDFAKYLLCKDSPFIREVALLIGLMVSSFPAFEKGKLFYCRLEIAKTEALSCCNNDFDSHMSIFGKARNEISWWVDNISSASSAITHGSPDVSIKTDASLDGWGATLNSSVTGGRWTQEESEFHINYLELLACFLALKAFYHDHTNIHVQIKSDSSTAVSYINHMGGIVAMSLDDLAKDIWLWCYDRQIWLSTCHIPGSSNVHADHESRHFNDNLEWKLNPAIFRAICNEFLTPKIDLFASRLNQKLGLFVSWRPDPEAFACDAFSLNWENFNFYAFPPFSLIGMMLHKIQREEATGICIILLWPTQPWFSHMLRLLIEIPVILPQRMDLLYLPHHSPREYHPLLPKLRLIACKLSGMPSASSRFLDMLPRQSLVAGDHLRGNSISQQLGSAYTSVLRGKLIHFKQL